MFLCSWDGIGDLRHKKSFADSLEECLLCNYRVEKRRDRGNKGTYSIDDLNADNLVLSACLDSYKVVSLCYSA